MLTFGELFAGIGGFSLGLERAGMKCQWQVEIDPYATQVLKKHWPEVPKHDDVRTFPPQGDHAVDVICGGFPCQDISVAGKGAGLAGARSGLWREFARIIGELRPRYVIVENVAALLTRGMGTVLSDLSALGYDAEWHIISAAAVGAPHRRERVWIVAWDAVGWRGARVGSVRAIQEGSCSDTDRVRADVPDGIGLGDALRGVGSAGSAAVAGRRLHAGGSQRNRGTRCAGQAGQGACDVADAQNDGRAGGARLRSDRERALSAEQGIVGREACGRGKSCRRSADATDAHRSRRQQQRRPKPVPPEQPAVECSGWWESEPNVGRVAHGVPSRVDRLRCLGNAVVPQIVEVIGRQIITHEERVRTGRQRS